MRGIAIVGRQHAIDLASRAGFGLSSKPLAGCPKHTGTNPTSQLTGCPLLHPGGLQQPCSRRERVTGVQR